jgi:hypothetical protein
LDLRSANNDQVMLPGAQKDIIESEVEESRQYSDGNSIFGTLYYCKGDDGHGDGQCHEQPSDELRDYSRWPSILRDRIEWPLLVQDEMIKRL